jgi:hypothetical protein
VRCHFERKDYGLRLRFSEELKQGIIIAQGVLGHPATVYGWDRARSGGHGKGEGLT